MLLRGFESCLRLESSGCSMWHFLKLVARGFLRVLQFPPLLHRFNGSAKKIKAQINAISTLSNLIAELSLRTKWHVTWHLHVISARCVARDLHTVAPGPLERACWRQFAALWGNSKKSPNAPLNAIIIILLLKHQASRWQAWTWFPCWPWIFCQVNSYLKIGTPVATLPEAWHCRVSAGTGWPGVSVLWLDEIESLICHLYLRVAAGRSRSVPEIHQHVAGTRSRQETT